MKEIVMREIVMRENDRNAFHKVLYYSTDWCKTHQWTIGEARRTDRRTERKPELTMKSFTLVRIVMNCRTLLLLALAASFVVTTSGCLRRRVIVHDAYPPPIVMQRAPQTPPPPPRVETPPPLPSPSHVWIEGYWVWERGWVWRPGVWVVRPQPRAVWVPGHWTRVPRGHVWRPGHWR